MKFELTAAQKEAKAAAVAMSPDLLSTARDINNTLTVAETRPVFQAHYANPQTEVFGIQALIHDILREAMAVFPRGIEGTALNGIAIAGSMFTSEILAEVQARFTAGTTRYPLQSVKNCLSTYGKKAGTIAKIQLTSDQDRPRNCSKPRCKWYLIQKAD